MLIVRDLAATGRVPATRLTLFLVPELAVVEASHYRGRSVCSLCVCVRMQILFLSYPLLFPYIFLSVLP